jgi:glucose/mannose transport system permease protein
MTVKRKTEETLISLAILSPTIITIGVFVYGFIGRSVQISILDWNNFGNFIRKAKEYVGLDNYIGLFKEARFQTDLWNTLYFTLFFIIGCLVIGIILSLILNNKPKGGYLFQNLFLFPMALSFVVTGTVWRWFFSPGRPGTNPHGINLLFQQLGLDNLQWGWFTSTSSIFNFNVALIAVIVAAIWQYSGYTMAMWLAGLRGIDEQLIEAARIDGASKWQIFSKILFPMQIPITLSAVIVLAHVSLKAFALIYSMTGSGPNNVTDIPAVYMFEATFRSNRYSTGSAIAIVLLIMVGLLIIPYLVHSFKEE